MIEPRLDHRECRDRLLARLAEPAPGRIQLLSGPRQVGKTTLLLDLAERLPVIAWRRFLLEGPFGAA
jgi:predicted AAA+ superfamily ATPase